MANFRIFKLKEFPDENFEIDGNGIKLTKKLKKHWGISQIAHYQQFLLFPQWL